MGDIDRLRILHGGLKVLELGEKTIENFGRNIRAPIRGLWKGQLTRAEFIAAMQSTINRGYHQAWLEGARACGITTLEDLTDPELQELETTIASDSLYVDGLADFVLEHTQEEGSKLAVNMARAEVWINAYNRVMHRAQQLACADQPLKWNYDPLKEHCSDCAALHGQVRRASFWTRVGIYPQSHELECRGFRCGCYFTITTEPLSRGRLPALTRGY